MHTNDSCGGTAKGKKKKKKEGRKKMKEKKNPVRKCAAECRRTG